MVWSKVTYSLQFIEHRRILFNFFPAGDTDDYYLKKKKKSLVVVE